MAEAVSLAHIKLLREQTGVSIAECRAALAAAQGDLDRARSELEKQSARTAEKKSERALKAGVVAAYVHQNRALGTLVELACETDFVARNPDFLSLADDLAMQVAAFDPADVDELLRGPFVRDQGTTVSEIIKSAVQKFGENIKIIGFRRLTLDGE